MAAWKYIKGSEKDFLGAPEWATCRMFNCQGAGTANKDNQAFTDGVKEGSKWVCTIDKTLSNKIKNPDEWYVIAQRERVTSINDDRLAHDMTRHEITKRDTNPVDESTRYDHVDGMMLRSTHGEWVKTDMDTYQKIKPFITDNVNHPKHYTQGGIECIDAIKAATVGKSGIEAVCVANVVKYLWRYEEKNGVEDVKKARWYLEHLINELSEGESK